MYDKDTRNYMFANVLTHTNTSIGMHILANMYMHKYRPILMEYVYACSYSHINMCI